MIIPRVFSTIFCNLSSVNVGLTLIFFLSLYGSLTKINKSLITLNNSLCLLEADSIMFLIFFAYSTNNLSEFDKI